jgi:hypothetical protein
VVGVRPGGHDLVDAHAPAAHGKVFRRPHSGAAAISSGSESTAHVANVPGHIVGCHGRRRRLGNRIHDGILDERRESIRHTQGVHRNDQIKGADLVRRDKIDLFRPDRSRMIKRSASKHEEQGDPAKETWGMHAAIIQVISQVQFRD